MYKKSLALFVVILFLLTACTPKEDLDDEDQDDLPINHTYTLTTENFENFYDIDYVINYDLTKSYEVLLSLEPKFEFDVTALDVTIYIEVTETYQNNNVNETFDIQIDSIDELEHIFERETTLSMINAYISDFDLVVDSGIVETKDEIELTTYEYPVKIDYVKVDDIMIEDPIENQENYRGFMDLIASMERLDANQMSARMTQITQVFQGIYNQIEQETTEIKIQNDPFYFSYTADSLTTHIHPYGDSDEYVVFDTHPYYMTGDNYLVSPQIADLNHVSELMTELSSTDDVEIVDDFEYNPDKMIFDKRINGYAIKALLKDFVTEDAYNDLTRIYELAGLDASILETTIVTMRLTYVDDLYELAVSMAFDFEEPVLQTVRSIMTYSIDYRTFTPKYITDDNMIALPATSMNRAVLETDPLISNTISSAPEPHFFKVYLEAGQYIMHIDNDYILMDVLDQDGMEGNQFIGYQNPSTWDFQDTFFIKDDGYYYFVAHSNYPVSEYTFYAEKLENEAEIYEPKTLVFGDNSIEILGKYDLDYFVFDAPRDMHLEVSSDAISLLFFQSVTNKKDFIQNYYMFEFNVGRNWIYVEEGLNYIYFNHPTPLDVTLHVKDYGELAHKSNVLGEMTIISDQFLQTPMLLGSEMEDSYLRFDAQKAVYTFSYESSNDILTPGIRIYRVSDDELIDYIYFDQTDHYNVIMEKGSYYIKISAYNYVEFNLKVDSTLIENQIIEETLGSVLTYNIAIDQMPYIEGMLINFEHQPRHRFTLESNSTIVVANGKFGHRLYDAQGNLLTFDHVNYGFARTLYFLEAGTYDIVTFMKYPPDVFVDYKLNVAIVETPVIQDTYYLIAPALFDPTVNIMNFTTDHSYDYEVIKLVVDETIEYYILANKTIYIYNADLEQVGGVSGNVTKYVTFEMGTYYLVSSQYPIGNLRISIYPSSRFD